MPSVLVISDSHGYEKEISAIVSQHSADAVIHCGDSELDFHAKELEGIYKVRGNCDFDARFPTEEIIRIDGVTFYVTHGHLHRVKEGLLPLVYRGEEVGADIICFGHTHIAGAEKRGNQLLINPGSIRYPRLRKEATYAIITWDEQRKFYIQHYNLDGTKVEGLFMETAIID